MSNIEQTIYRMIDFENIIKVEKIKRDEVVEEEDDLIYCRKCLALHSRHSKHIVRPKAPQRNSKLPVCQKTPKGNSKQPKVQKSKTKPPKTPKVLPKASPKVIKIKVDKRLIKPNTIEYFEFACSECHKRFETNLKLKHHKARSHKFLNVINVNESLEKLTKTYTTQLAVKEELKLNIPTRTNLRTYTRTKSIVEPIVFNVKEEPEYIVPD